MSFTTSSILLKTLANAGITHVFVNWGSDHPAFLEDLQRQRAEQDRLSPEIIISPNEMVGLSCAHGYAQVSGKPAAVLVHVDVGTQGLGGAVHNADRGRVPILIYAGAAAFTLEGELKGSRNEFMFGIQDALDQPTIVRQYMRHTAQINSGINVGQVIMRALQFAQSDPPGPVYLWARREVMEEEYDQANFKSMDISKWPITDRATLSDHTAITIAKALLSAKKPLIITSYLGRNPNAVDVLVTLSEKLAIPVYLSCPTSVSFPLTHPHFVGLSYGQGENTYLREADVILVLDSDLPWIPMQNRPKPDAQIFHIDVDVLKQNMGMFHIDAEITAKADCEQALSTILELMRECGQPDQELIKARNEEITAHHELWFENLHQAELLSDGNTTTITVSYLLSRVRELVPSQTLFLNEGISNYIPVWTHLLPSPRGMFTSGATSLGWSLGAAIGATFAERSSYAVKHDLIVAIVGDGSFLFSVPSSAYWIANRYNTPFLTIVLNNGGWKSPKVSMLGVYPTGLGSQAQSSDLNITFGPDSPDYVGIAVAASAGKAWGKRISNAQDVDSNLKEAIRAVVEEKRCAILEVELPEL